MRQWPALPVNRQPNHAYGVLEVRAGEWDEEELDALDDDQDACTPAGSVRYCELARVDLSTGELFTEGYLSRDGYDWGVDDLVFLPYRTDIEIVIEEGSGTDFCLDADDLPAVDCAWQGFLAGVQAKYLERRTAQAPRVKSPSGSRL